MFINISLSLYLMNHQINESTKGKIDFSDDALIPPSQVLHANKLVAMGYEIHFCKHLTFIRAKNGNMNEIVKEDLDELGSLLYIDFNEPNFTRIVLRGLRTPTDDERDIQAENDTRRSLRN